MSTNDGDENTNGDCIIPDGIPANEFGLYSVVRDKHAEDDIASYITSQAPDENIEHVEKIKTEYVLGKTFEIWDVTTDINRWWVITNPTNLYLQSSFQSLDYTLSFHIGLMMRILAQKDNNGELAPSPFSEVSRRLEQAHALLGRAIEAEEYQAIGMLLRECLVTLITAMRRRVDLEDNSDLPKAADFVGWADVLMNQLCAGSSNKTLRQYLKTTAKQTWQLVNWLTHARNANQGITSIAVRGADTIFDHFAQVLVGVETESIDKCLSCSSRNIRTFYDVGLGEDGEYYSSCGECDWTNHPSYIQDVSTTSSPPVS